MPSHEFPSVQAGFEAHWQAPLTQRSPWPQHRVPQAGPSRQPPEAAHDSGFASTVPASGQASAVQLTPPAVHMQELQLSPAGNTSPTAWDAPM